MSEEPKPSELHTEIYSRDSAALVAEPAGLASPLGSKLTLRSLSHSLSIEPSKVEQPNHPDSTVANTVISTALGDGEGKDKLGKMPPSPKSSALSQATIMKYTSLVILTLQNTALVLVMRYARTRKGPMFLASVSVIMGEIVKLFVCFALLAYEHGWNVVIAWIEFRDKVLRQPFDTLKVAVPSLIYTIQNNLLYIAVSNLDAATFQVSYQLKIFTTAVFSVVMLSKPLSRTQWFSLGLLFVGVSIVQISNMNFSSSSNPAPSNATPVVNTTPADAASSAPEQSYTIGIMSVLVACILSGFAGVYFEKILKGSDLSLWLRNIQLAALSLPLAFITAFITDGSKIMSDGFFVGFNWLVWAVILLQSLGGLLVAVVVKYADNILKGFATSAAIVLSCFLTWAFFSTHLSALFNLGAAFVVAAVFFYSAYPPAPHAKAGSTSNFEGRMTDGKPPSPSNLQFRTKGAAANV